MAQIEESRDLISVIITVLNGEQWIDNCMESIIKQTTLQSYNEQEVHQEQHCRDHQQIIAKKLENSTAQKSFMSTMTISQSSAPSSSATTVHAKTSDFQNSIMPLLEVCVFDDYSSDNTLKILNRWKILFKQHFNIVMHIVENTTGTSKGVGYGRNKAIAVSKGSYFCFQDIDDEMLPDRILKQYNMAKQFQNAIIGCKFMRIPSNSTCRFARWANDLQPEKLMLQIYTSNGPTVIMPTWLCHRQVYENIAGGFSEEGKGCPEDLIFFYKHLGNQGLVKCVEECLLKYRYHPAATTFSVHAKTIWQIRLKHLMENVLKNPPWCNGFSIWNAGKQGRRLFRDLPLVEKKKVKAFCDVDKNKINKPYKYYDSVLRQTTFSIPIVHFSEVQPPVVICMKLDLTNGDFEKNLQSLKFVEGDDYILFS